MVAGSEAGPKRDQQPGEELGQEGGGQAPRMTPHNPSADAPRTQGPEQPSEGNLQFSLAPAWPFPEPGCFLFLQPNNKLCGSEATEHASGCSLQPTPTCATGTRGTDSFTRLLGRTLLTRAGRSKDTVHPAKEGSAHPLGTQLRGTDTLVRITSIPYLKKFHEGKHQVQEPSYLCCHLQPLLTEK